jgi:hypothetical protein
MHIFNKTSVRATRFLLSSAFSGYQTILRLKQETTDVGFTSDIHRAYQPAARQYHIGLVLNVCDVVSSYFAPRI